MATGLKTKQSQAKAKKPSLERIHIGTSGWEYKHWMGTFYPEGMRVDEHLQYYCKHFSTVEINNTFYQLPTEKKLLNWYEIIKEHGPEDFVFAVKGSRFTTHMKKLKNPQESAGRFFESILPLRDLIGPILFQLPPHWACNPERLDSFLQGLPKVYRYTFELRDESWFTDEVNEVLEKHNAAFCIYQIAGRQSPLTVTSDLIYIRLHGPEETAYTGQYDHRTLNRWADRLIDWSAEGRDVYIYFDNDQVGYAAADAKYLNDAVRKRLAE